MFMEISNIILSIIFKAFIQTWYIWVIIIFLIVLGGVIRILKPKIKGLIGEKEVAFFLSKLDSEKYKVINNLKVDINREKTQIDHLVISNYGIFVIETKNYKGRIYGDESTNYWTQIFYEDKIKFYNPIKQNDWHVKALKDILNGYPSMLYFPIVVFIEGSDLRVNTITDVVYTRDLIKTIRQHRTEIIPDDIRDDIYNYLINLNIKTK